MSKRVLSYLLIVLFILNTAFAQLISYDSKTNEVYYSKDDFIIGWKPNTINIKDVKHYESLNGLKEEFTYNGSGNVEFEMIFVDWLNIDVDSKVHLGRDLLCGRYPYVFGTYCNDDLFIEGYPTWFVLEHPFCFVEGKKVYIPFKFQKVVDKIYLLYNMDGLDIPKDSKCDPSISSWFNIDFNNRKVINVSTTTFDVNFFNNLWFNGTGHPHPLLLANDYVVFTLYNESDSTEYPLNHVVFDLPVDPLTGDTHDNWEDGDTVGWTLTATGGG